MESTVDEKIIIDDVAKLDIRIGEIKTVSFVEGSDKLLLFSVDLGEKENRTILSGVRKHFADEQVLVGKKVPVIANLAKRQMMGHISDGMIMYAVGRETLDLLQTDQSVANGTQVR